MFNLHQGVPDYPANTRKSKTEQNIMAANLHKDSIHWLVDKATQAWRLHNKHKRFGATFADVTTTQWVKNNLSLGLTVASANHLRVMMHRNVV